MQIAVQGRLGERVGSIEAVATASLIGAAVALVVLLLARRSLAGIGDAVAAPKWMLLGGVMSALIILAITIAGPRIGIVATTATLIAAQFTLAAAIDRFGWFGVERIDVTWQRVVGHQRSSSSARRSRCAGERGARRPRAPLDLDGVPGAHAHRPAAEGRGRGAGPRARVGRRARARDGGRRRGQRRRSRSCDERAGGCADGRAPGAPRHGVRARPGQPERPARGTDRSRSRGRLGVRGGHDTRCRQRDRSRRRVGGRRRSRRVPRAARAALHRLRGAGARRREGARPGPRRRAAPPEPRRDEQRRDHGGLRRQRAHVRSSSPRPRIRSGRLAHALRRGDRPEGRPLRSQHRSGPAQRDQGARTRPGERPRRRDVPTRHVRRRREPQRDPTRRPRADRSPARVGADGPRGHRPGGRTASLAVRRHGRRVRRRGRGAGARGRRRRARRRPSARSTSCAVCRPACSR